MPYRVASVGGPWRISQPATAPGRPAYCRSDASSDTGVREVRVRKLRLAKIPRLIAIAVFVVLVLSTVSDIGVYARDWQSWTVRVLALGILLWGAHRYNRRTYATPVRSSHLSMPFPAVSEEDAYALQRQAGLNTVSPRAAQIFTVSVITPLELRQRIVERYETGQHTLRQTVSLELRVPLNRFRTEAEGQGPPPLLPITVAMPLKGDLHDGFELLDADGRHVPDLAYPEGLRLAAGTLRMLLMRAYDITDKTSGSLCQQAEQAEHLALMEIVRRGRGNAAQVEARARALEDLAANLDGPPVLFPEALRTAAALVRRLATHYAIVALTPVPADGQLILRYQRTLVPKLGPSADGVGPTTWKKKLRLLLGARPAYVGVGLENAWTCQSYHLEVHGPDGLYLSRQKFRPSSEDYFHNRTRHPGRPPYCRFQHRLGQPYGHFYARFFPTPPRSEDGSQQTPEAQFTFHELPPGSDFSATVNALSAFFLITLIGFVLSHRSLDFGSDAPVLLLAFPGVAASWLGFDLPSGRLLDGSLSARLSLIVTAAVSLMASGLYIICRSNVKPWLFDYSLPPHIALLGIRNAWWAALALVASCNAILITQRWIVRSWRYGYLSTRSSFSRSEPSSD
jgi:hypothetical protein